MSYFSILNNRSLLFITGETMTNDHIHRCVDMPTPTTVHELRDSMH